MPLNHRVAVIGSAILAPMADDRRSLEEHLYDVTQQALKDAGIGIDAIDGIVVAANDQYDGRAIAIMAASGSVGGVDRDILSTPSAGEHAFVMGALRVATGQYRTQLVVAWGPTEASSLSEAERLGADPYFHRALPLDDLSSFALQAGAVVDAHAVSHELAAALVEKNRRAGALAYPDLDVGTKSAADIAATAPIDWPLTEGMVRPPVGGAVALVLAGEAYVQETGIAQPAWVRGMGWATEAAFLGDRNLREASALDAAARHAFDEAGIDGVGSVDLIELTAPTPYQELMLYDRLGMAGPERWAEQVSGADKRWSVNPSGGLSSLNPVFCGGLIRIAEAANQVRGTAGAHQASRSNVALAHAASGPAMMYQTVVILGRNQ